ncbi:MAG: tRNA-intron lyase [Candidatus Aenigmarchaeota archaeon]|nr:tRNA-intron lyase [Candidatus Aenigmarchaeota archaeon]
MPKKIPEKEAKAKYAKEKPAAARLLTNKVFVPKNFDPLLEKNYGKHLRGGLELGLVEALYLLEKGKINISKEGKKVTFQKLLEHALKKDKRIHEKLAVYSDLRDRGLVVKTGFKFGCDFRVYQRGVGVKRGPKAPGEHTKWIVYAVPEDYKCSFQELSRAVRLAHSIRARMLWALVDNEADVTFFEVMRLKP